MFLKQPMKKITLYILLSLFSAGAFAQAKTTEALQAKFDKSLSLYFYKNTLRMLNQTDDKQFDELIRNIEKLKFLMINKTDRDFNVADYKQLANDYKGESYESIMTSRYQGRNFDIYFKDGKGSTPGTIVVVNDSTSLFVLDMVGTIDVSKVGTLFSTIDGSTDIGNRIKSFMKDKDERIEERKKN